MINQTPVHDVPNPDLLQIMLPNYKRVCEVGSSSGALAKAYRESNPSAAYIGIEIDQEFASLSARFCTEAIHGDIEKFSNQHLLYLRTCDCFVFGDVLEHLYDPWGLLSRLCVNADVNFDVCVCVPNAQFYGIQCLLNGGNFYYQDSGLMDRTHIRWFTRKTVLSLFKDLGFEITDFRCRQGRTPSPPVEEAIRNLASTSGYDPEEAYLDSLTFQYVIRASYYRGKS